MKAVVHKCPNCKANLDVKEGDTNGVCEYCRAPYSIDDGVIRVEHTVEIKNDNPLKIANTTLYKFKEYEEAEVLFRDLIFELGHKPEVYIGLILSITHEFTKEITTVSAMNEINELWERYTAIGRPKEIAKYKDTYIEVNRKFWLKELNHLTDHLKDYKCSASVKLLDTIYTNYVSYCDEESKNKLNTKYTKFKDQKVLYETKKKKTIKFTFITILTALIIIFLVSYLTLINEKPQIISYDVKVSDLHNECDLDGNCDNYKFLINNFERGNSLFKFTNVVINKELLKLTFDVEIINFYKAETYNYTFNIVDDYGPIITDKHCEFTDTDKIDLTKCFTLYDYSDGEISSDKATIYTEAVDFTSAGNKIVNLEATDSNGNVTNGTLMVNVVNSDITLNLNISKDYIELNKNDTLTYSITPDVLNKKVTYEYNQEYISFDENTKKITAIKVGETELCATPEYDVSKKTCIKIRIIPICKSTYTFKFDGSSEVKLTAGVDFCPGKYKVYAGVLNKTNSYTIRKYSKNHDVEFISIWKDVPALTDEGKKYAFGMDSYLDIPSGVSSIKLVKTN